MNTDSVHQDLARTQGSKGKRRRDIDWLRVIAVLFLFPFHTARIFDFEGFYVKDVDQSGLLQAFVIFVDQWQMPLLMLLAGASTWFALGFRSGGQYAMERLKRLFIPFLFGWAVLIPAQIYYGLRANPANHYSYLEVYRQFFTGGLKEYPIEFGHLWFILYLFVFSLFALPIFLRLRGQKSSRLLARLGPLSQRKGGLLLMLLPLVVFEWLRQGLGELDLENVGRLSLFGFFVFGFLLFAQPRLWEGVVRHGKTALVLGVITAAAYVGLSMGFGILREDSNVPGWVYVILALLVGVNPVLWLVAILSFGKRFLDRGGRVLRYAAEAAYPLYILHQTVIVVIGFYVVQWEMDVNAKFLVILVAAFVGTVGIYDLLVRRVNVLRFLFGMKPKPRASAAGVVSLAGESVV